MKFTVAAILICILFACENSSSSNEELILENNLFSKTFSFSNGKPGAILVDLKQKNEGEIVSASSSLPFFEFVVNNQIVSAKDKYWVFQDSESRKMQNGGTEYTLVFEGKKKVVNGLKVMRIKG